MVVYRTVRIKTVENSKAVIQESFRGRLRDDPNCNDFSGKKFLFWIGGRGNGCLREVVALECSTVNILFLFIRFAQTSKDEKKRCIGFELSFDQWCLDYHGSSLMYFLFSHHFSSIQVPIP